MDTNSDKPLNAKARKAIEKARKAETARILAEATHADSTVEETEPGFTDGPPTGTEILSRPPKAKKTRKPKTPKACSCGCGGETRGGRFIPGHDSKLKSWMLAIERKACTLEQIPEGVRGAVKAHMVPASV